MQINKDIFIGVLNEVVQMLIDKHRALGMRATGEWETSLEVDVNDNVGVIKGNKYTEQLVFGRKDGARPPIAPLERWVNAKFGISGKEAKSIAFAVAKKIEKEGTEYYKQGGTDLLELIQSREVIDLIFSKISTTVTPQIEKELIRNLKVLA